MAKASQSKSAKGKGKPETRRRGKKAAPDADQLLGYYRDMLLIRRFEERAGQMYGMGLIGGFCHLYIGQEAVVVGMQSAIDDRDAVITSYRDHGHMLACGMEAKGVMAELTGRIGGYSKGKGGSMHMFSKEKRFYGGHGIVGAQVPIGTGLAFAAKYKGTDGVSLTYLGDGAVNQGQDAVVYAVEVSPALPAGTTSFTFWHVSSNQLGTTSNVQHHGEILDVVTLGNEVLK